MRWGPVPVRSDPSNSVWGGGEQHTEGNFLEGLLLSYAVGVVDGYIAKKGAYNNPLCMRTKKNGRK